MNDNQSHISANDDQRFMAAAIRLARRNEGQTGDNPSVACVIVREENGNKIIVGSGVTAIGGRPHAEPIALAEAGELAKGTTAYVTLEPCAHHGKTPPCAQTLVNAGVARVVTAHIDPDIRVNQLGHQLLRNAGVQVSVDCLASEAGRGLSAYLIQKRHKRPQVTLKVALSSNGYLGVKGEGQIKITGPLSKNYTHLMRSRHHAILVGAQTILEDDPGLTCRLNGMEERSPVRIVIDPNGRVPVTAKVFQTSNVVKTIVVASPDFDSNKRVALAALDVEVIDCEYRNGRIDLLKLLQDLARLGIQSVMVEGGAKTAKSFLNANLVDELCILQGPKSIAEVDESLLIKSPILPNTLPQNFKLHDTLCLGEDVMTHYICDTYAATKT